MPTQVQLRRGTTAEHSSFTGAAGEVTVDTTKKTVVVHDGSTAGGIALAKETNATLAGSVNFSGGTANGVMYLNGSKVATTGSALTFDGTNFGTTGNITLENSRYFQSKTTGGSTIRMLGINSGNTAYIGPIDSGPGDAIINASSSSTTLQLYTGGSERARFSSTGNFTIGGTNDSARLRVEGTTNLTAGLQLFRSGNSCGAIWQEAGALRFGSDGSTGFTERAQIDLSGNLGVGCVPGSIWPSATSASGDNGSTYRKTFLSISSNASILQYLNRNDGDGTITQYYRTGTAVGSVSVTSSATAYNTSSDYRLKDNPQPLTGSGAFIDALKPKTWEWKVDGSKGVGFIAHEVQEVSPGSVVGEKDGEQMQAMEYGSAEFIANIIAELQSLRQRVAQLEGA